MFAYRSESETGMHNDLWYFSIFVGGCMRETESKLGNASGGLMPNVIGWFVVVFVCGRHSVTYRECKGTSGNSG